MDLAFNIGDQLKTYYSESPEIGNSLWAGDVFPIFWTIVKNLYFLTGIVLLFFLVAGGLGMIINAGNVEKQKQSSQTLTSAVVGYLIMFAAYWLVKIVEIVFGVEIFLL